MAVDNLSGEVVLDAVYSMTFYDYWLMLCGCFSSSLLLVNLSYRLFHTSLLPVSPHGQATG